MLFDDEPAVAQPIVRREMRARATEIAVENGEMRAQVETVPDASGGLRA